MIGLCVTNKMIVVACSTAAFTRRGANVFAACFFAPAFAACISVLVRGVGDKSE
jgi:hypothetical protein